MAEDAPASLALLASLSSAVRASLFLGRLACRPELLSYLMLCVSKMPFIPPASVARSVSGRTGTEKPTDDPASAPTPARVQGERGSAKERPPRSRLPTARGARERPAPTREAVSKTDSVENQPEPEARFTLTLTPEAVVLLQRRSSRSAARRPSGGSPDPPPEARRRKGNLPRRRPSSSRRRSGQRRDPDPDADLGSVVKISLLNDKHKYDDVEYEEEEDLGLDERVLLKCTEWLRGLENAPLSVGLGPDPSSGLKGKRMNKLKREPV